MIRTFSNKIETPEDTPKLSYCLNCDEKLTGDYCAACGQKNIGARLNSRLMLHNLFESLTDLSSKPWWTLIELAKNPGKVALAYIGGARSSYINPIRYMITTFAIYIGFLAANGWLDAAVVENMNVSMDGNTSGDDDFDTVIRSVAGEIRNIFSQQRDLLTFFVVPMFTLLLRWILFKTERNFAETLTFTCYVLGQIQLYGFLVSLVPFFFESVDYAGTPGFIPFIVMWIGVGGFYQRKWLKTFLMALLAYFLFSAVNGLVALSLALLNLNVL